MRVRSPADPHSHGNIRLTDVVCRQRSLNGLPVSSPMMTLTREESDDKCPLSGNEACDKSHGASRAAPLRCNKKRWMAQRTGAPR